MSIQPPVLPFSPHEGMADITQQHVEEARDHNAVAQARAAMPKMEENDDSVFEATTGVKNTALGKAYSAASDWLCEHEKNLSEKYLAPFRAGLDNMATDLQQAGASGHTASGGELSPLSRALVSGAGTMLRSVPVGKDVKDTLARNATIPGKPSGIDFSGIPGHIEHGAEEALGVSRKAPQSEIKNGITTPAPELNIGIRSMEKQLVDRGVPQENIGDIRRGAMDLKDKLGDKRPWDDFYHDFLQKNTAIDVGAKTESNLVKSSAKNPDQIDSPLTFTDNQTGITHHVPADELDYAAQAIHGKEKYSSLTQDQKDEIRRIAEGPKKKKSSVGTIDVTPSVKE